MIAHVQRQIATASGSIAGLIASFAVVPAEYHAPLAGAAIIYVFGAGWVAAREAARLAEWARRRGECAWLEQVEAYARRRLDEMGEPQPER